MREIAGLGVRAEHGRMIVTLTELHAEMIVATTEEILLQEANRLHAVA